MALVQLFCMVASQAPPSAAGAATIKSPLTKEMASWRRHR